jgi:cytochrome c553
MDRALITLAAALSLFASGTTFAQTPAKAATCAACHGERGNSVNPEWPNLAGQHATYSARQLHAFKSGQRVNDLMTGMVADLTDQDIKELAAYFAGLEHRIGATEQDLLARGAAIYRGGLKEVGVPACMACHGPRGNGNGPAAYPSLSGQHAVYTEKQLLAYRAGQRQTDAGAIMRTIAARMSAEDIKAVASFTAGLH